LFILVSCVLVMTLGESRGFFYAQKHRSELSQGNRRKVKLHSTYVQFDIYLGLSRLPVVSGCAV
jgi:hypothetical protein